MAIALVGRRNYAQHTLTMYGVQCTRAQRYCTVRLLPKSEEISSKSDCGLVCMWAFGKDVPPDTSGAWARVGGDGAWMGEKGTGRQGDEGRDE